jgi:hypothetical protein
VKDLCDRVLLRQPWIAGFEPDGDLDHLAAFRVFLPDPSNRVHFHPKDARFERAFGLFDGRSGAPDAASFRKTLNWLKKNHPLQAVLVARDSDQDESRRLGIRQAMHEHRDDFDVALAFMVPESEAWRIAIVDRETCKPQLQALRQTLGFDPIAEPHRLSSSPKSKGEAKAVADRLYGSEGPPIDDRALDILGRHEGCGAAQYLRELQTAVIEPVVGGDAS